MKLLNLTLENYRRFVGIHKITFANDKQKNVTLIRAENGAGKTGILMALLFGLFGTIEYNQFQIDNDNDVMVSRTLLETNKDATAKVEIEFLHDNNKYKIIREVYANNINGNITQNNNDIKVRFYENGIDKEFTVEQTNKFMDSIVGENIRGFLFFDGVRYTDLFKNPNRESKKELKKIIEKMLNINDLDDTIAAVNFLEKQVTNSTNDKRLKNQQKEKLNEKETLLSSIAIEEQAIENLHSNNEKLEDEKEKQLKKINENKEHQEYINQINKNNQQIEKIDLEYINIISRLKDNSNKKIINKINTTLGKQFLKLFNKIESENDGLTKIITTILNREVCICSDNKLTQEQINYLKESLDLNTNTINHPPQVHNFALMLIKQIETESDNSNFFSTISSELLQLLDLKEKLEKENAALSELLPFSDINTLISESRNINQNFGVVNGKIEMNKQNIFSHQEKIISMKRQIEEIEKRLDHLNSEIAVLNNEEEKYLLFNNTKNKLIKLRESYLKDAQKQISIKANEYFLNLLSDDDKAAIKKLNINSDYQIEAYNFDNHEIFVNLSAGQKLLASMAFIMGLTAVAAKAKPKTNFPLVMDTPMSNLDARNRERLIKAMPDAVIQWILTPMDTELTQTEIDVFARENRVGKVYSLEKNKEISIIKEYETLKELREKRNVK